VITIVSLFVGVILIIALGVLDYSIAHSPDGYEDAAGFHYRLA
jgi:hypothetical protein